MKLHQAAVDKAPALPTDNNNPPSHQPHPTTQQPNRTTHQPSHRTQNTKIPWSAGRMGRSSCTRRPWIRYVGWAPSTTQQHNTHNTLVKPAKEHKNKPEKIYYFKKKHTTTTYNIHTLPRCARRARTAARTAASAASLPPRTAQFTIDFRRGPRPQHTRTPLHVPP